ncbi:hypothetical protein MLD38_026927 [Melastoma candidum]|uniref:Uncharacterized protein n=1 Tax=Melastoma candidum TaxID=119954 RepID=A0ACB9P324_9MYRT|nr:hypothetical protein MLD38_026927 [Melastoma candidum]
MAGDDVDMSVADNPEAELDEMKRRLKEMEDEAAALRGMHAKVEGEMGSAQGPVVRPLASAAPFHSCGTVNRVTIRSDNYGQPKGYAYVEFLEPEAAQEALLLNESELHGRQLKVTAKRTNVPGMKQYRPRRSLPLMGARYMVPYMPPFYTPYGYGKAPRFSASMRYSPYY